MAKGRITRFDPEDGQGFIQPDEDHEGEEIPFEADEVVDYHEGDVIQEGEEVTYEVEGGMAGITATDIRRLAPRGYE